MKNIKMVLPVMLYGFLSGYFTVWAIKVFSGVEVVDSKLVIGLLIVNLSLHFIGELIKKIGELINE